MAVSGCTIMRKPFPKNRHLADCVRPHMDSGSRSWFQFPYTGCVMDQPRSLEVLREDRSRIRKVAERRRGMLNLITASAYFLLIHFGVSGTRLRDRLVTRLGAGPYRGAFALASVVGLVWMSAQSAIPHRNGCRVMRAMPRAASSPCRTYSRPEFRHQSPQLHRRRMPVCIGWFTSLSTVTLRP